MSRLLIFILRLVLAVAFSVILTRVFHPERSVVFIVGMAIVLIALAYVLEYMKNKDGDTGS